MCGFGDKDRRPITPPPCIRLIVKDAQTEKEIDIKYVIRDSVKEKKQIRC